MLRWAYDCVLAASLIVTSVFRILNVWLFMRMHLLRIGAYVFEFVISFYRDVVSVNICEVSVCLICSNLRY